MVTAVVPLLFLTPMLLLHRGLDWLFFPLMAAAAALLFHRLRDPRPVFAAYGLVLLYCLMRVVGLL